jgi:hydrogenase-1 operon protein HyaE
MNPLPASPLAPTAPTAARFDTLLNGLASRHGVERLEGDALAAFERGPGERLLVLLEDPVRTPENWDLAVLLPEIARLLRPPVAVAIACAPAARPVALAHGVQTWPALLLLRDGAMLGAIEGLRDWAGYAEELPRLQALEAAPRRPAVIAIRAAARPSC